MGGKENDFFAEEQQEETSFETETVTEENTEGTAQEPDRYAALEAKLDRALQALSAQAPGQRSESSVEKPKLTKEQVAAIKEDPSLLVEILDSHTKQVETRVEGRMQQRYWDEKAYKDYPALSTDKAFEGKVTREIQQLVASGAMDKQNPQLLYQAVRLAAANYKVSTGNGQTMTKKTPNAVAPGNRERGAKPVDESDVRSLPNYNYLKMAGWKEDKIKAAMGRHKKREIIQKTDPISGKVRRVIRLGGES